MSKLRRGKAAGKNRSVQCRSCGSEVEVLDSSKLGYDFAQWQCLRCGRWSRFSAGPGELTIRSAGGSSKPAAAVVFAWE